MFVAPAPGDGVTAVALDEGHGAFAWAADGAEGMVFSFETSGDITFAAGRELYRGPDRGTYVSGLGEGTHYFRVGVVGSEGRAGEWSEVLTVTVTYPAARRVSILLAAGSLVLVFTVASIVIGYRRTTGS